LKKKCLVLVSNDLTFDQRVRKTCDSLLEAGFEIALVGVHKKSSKELSRPYHTHRLNVLFSKGSLFYAVLNIRLFFFILFRKNDLVWCNDLDTLLPAAMLKKLKGYTLIYDSHEYFTEAEGLTGRGFVRSIWEKIERFAVPKADVFITVNESIADIYSTIYHRFVHVLRNMPNVSSGQVDGKVPELNFQGEFVLLQGAYIDPDRGGIELVQAFEFIHNKKLLVVGSGRDVPNMKSMVRAKGLSEKVVFLDRLPPEELRELTKRAWLGVSLDKPIHLNYALSLPNKVFDYIHAEIPVLVSPLIELKRLVDTYQVGIVLKEVSPTSIAETINALSDEQRMKFCSNARRAKLELVWENDISVVMLEVKKQTQR
jgi:glycosyltransferase involved in cell wall biosynthesis